MNGNLKKNPPASPPGCHYQGMETMREVSGVATWASPSTLRQVS